jgi:hypothetical protein
MVKSTRRCKVATHDEAKEVFTAAEWILGIPPVGTDAVAVCMGLGEEVRLVHGIRRWRAGKARWLLIAGENPDARTFSALTQEQLRRDGVIGGFVLTQVEAANTKIQAQWLVAQVVEHQIRSIELHAPSYHIVRAYLTVLASMDERQPFILVPHATPYSPDYIIPETGAHAIDMTPGEYERIRSYQANGDVATLSQLQTYLQWLWRQPEFAEFRP